MLGSSPSIDSEAIIVDWTSILQELRLLATQLQTDRFYAFYLLIAMLVVNYVITQHRR